MNQLRSRDEFETGDVSDEKNQQWINYQPLMVGGGVICQAINSINGGLWYVKQRANTVCVPCLHKTWHTRIVYTQHAKSTYAAFPGQQFPESVQ
jgi:hypothetical protein